MLRVNWPTFNFKDKGEVSVLDFVLNLALNSSFLQLEVLRGYIFFINKKSLHLTLISIISKGIESSHHKVQQVSQVERDAPPKGDVAWEPKENSIFCDERKI